MPQYTVTAVADQTRPWGNDMVSYRVTLRNGQGAELGNVDVSRKNTQPAPKPGDVLDGEVDTSGQYGPKFKAARRGGGGFRGRDPKERAEIRRQHAQTTALRWVELQHARGQLPEQFGTSELMRLVDHFYTDSGGAS